MLKAKYKWATFEHAHRLAVEGKVDICVTWRLPAPSPNPYDNNKRHRAGHTVHMTLSDLYVYNKAAALGYKPHPLQRDDDEPDMEVGGFYAVVPMVLFKSLREVIDRHSDKFFMGITTMPKKLSYEELEYLEDYHAWRIEQSEELVAKQKAEEEKAAKEKELREYQQRKANSYAAAVQRDKEQLWNPRIDWRVGDVAESEQRWDEVWLKMTGGWYD